MAASQLARGRDIFEINHFGQFLHPSKKAIETRMNLLYPGFKLIVDSAKDGTTSAQTEGHKLDSHIAEVWRIATTIDKNARAGPYAFKVDRDAFLGERINFLVRLYHTAKDPQAEGLAAGSAADLQPVLPSHEEMMAYLILTPRYEFPDKIAKALKGTPFEYLMHPLVPFETDEPDESDGSDETVRSCSRCRIQSQSDKTQIARLEHKLKVAESKLESHISRLRDLKEAKAKGKAETEKHRYKICKDAAKQLIDIMGRGNDISFLFKDIQGSLDLAVAQHKENLEGFQKYSDKMKVRAEDSTIHMDIVAEKKKKKGNNEVEDEQCVRPAKIRRTA